MFRKREAEKQYSSPNIRRDVTPFICGAREYAITSLSVRRNRLSTRRSRAKISWPARRRGTKLRGGGEGRLLPVVLHATGHETGFPPVRLPRHRLLVSRSVRRATIVCACRLSFFFLHVGFYRCVVFRRSFVCLYFFFFFTLFTIFLFFLSPIA